MKPVKLIPIFAILLLVTVTNYCYSKCIEGDCRDGQGTFTSTSGHKYVGQWKNGKKHGQGTYTWDWGDKYVGQWYFNERDGQGTFTSGDNKYVGQWESDTQWGQGTYTQANGDKYVGQWRRGYMHGQGTYTWVYGNKYVGQWETGKMHGKGTFTRANGDKYVGQWNDSKMHGQGTYSWVNGNKYIGQWKDNAKHGQGTYSWVNGDKYVGQWSNNKKHQGIYIFADGREPIVQGKEGKQPEQETHTTDNRDKYVGQYVGQLKNGKRHGQGTVTYADGSKYVGQWHENKKCGQGEYYFADGRSYVGQWKEGIHDERGTYTFFSGDKYVGQWGNFKQHGQGTYTYDSGGKYVGQWKNGKKYGKGTFTYASGNKYVGQWENDKRHGQGTYTHTFKNSNNRGRYVGQWKNDKKHGQGTYFYSWGGKKYVGQWKNGKRHGQGVETRHHGEGYIGRWAEGQKVTPGVTTKAIKSFRLDSPGGSMEHIIRQADQKSLSLCAPFTLALQLDTYRISLDGDYAFQASALAISSAATFFDRERGEEVETFGGVYAINFLDHISDTETVLYSRDEIKEDYKEWGDLKEYLDTLEEDYNNYFSANTANKRKICIKRIADHVNFKITYAEIQQALRKDELFTQYTARIFKHASKGKVKTLPKMKLNKPFADDRVNLRRNLARFIRSHLRSKKDQPILVIYCSNFLYDNTKYFITDSRGVAMDPANCGPHASLIIGSRYYKGNQRKWQLLIQNTWGPDCSGYFDPEICKDGKIWVPADRLIANSFNLSQLQ